MKIHEKIKRYSEDKKESRTDIAKEYGVTQQAISNYFYGKNAMPVDFLVWYVSKHPDIDLYALFSTSQQNIVKEESANYARKPRKQDIINKIVRILEDEI